MQLEFNAKAQSGQAAKLMQLIQREIVLQNPPRFFYLSRAV